MNLLKCALLCFVSAIMENTSISLSSVLFVFLFSILILHQASCISSRHKNTMLKGEEWFNHMGLFNVPFNTTFTLHQCNVGKIIFKKQPFWRETSVGSTQPAADERWFFFSLVINLLAHCNTDAPRYCVIYNSNQRSMISLASFKQLRCSHRCVNVRFVKVVRLDVLLLWWINSLSTRRTTEARVRKRAHACFCVVKILFPR